MKHTELREAFKIIDEDINTGIPLLSGCRYIAKAIVIAAVILALAIRGRGTSLLGDE